MAVLHDELSRLIGELCTDASMKADVVRGIFARHAVSLSEPQLQSIIQAIDNGSDSVEVAGLTQPLAIGSEDIEQALREFEDKWELGIDRAIFNVLDSVPPRILESLYTALPEELQRQRAMQHGFEERLYQRWQDGLDRLEMLIIMAHEGGETCVEDLQREFAGQAPSQESVLMDVLVALHCRACRTAREILCLLKAGYADGADARWRSLYEVAVIALFLLQHQGDAPQRYLDHAGVERWRAAQQYQIHCHALGYEPYTDKELGELREEADDVIRKYGAPFKEDYGWAAQALAIARPSFTQIEASLDMSRWRPHFRRACQSVHASSQGLFSLLALPSAAETMLLTGASDTGLADPGHQAAISLTMATVALLTARPNLDGLVTCDCLLRLCDHIGGAFMQASETLDDEMNSPEEAEA